MSNPKVSGRAQFALKNIRHWRERIFNLSSKWDRAQRVYAMQDSPRSDERAGSASVDLPESDAVVLEAGSAQLFGYIDSLAAHVVPPRPAVNIKSRRKKFDNIAKGRSLLVDDLFEREKFADKLYKLTTRSSVFPRAFLKATWSFKYNRPIFRTLKPHFVFFDSTVDEWSDVRWICEVTVRTKGEVQARTKKRGSRDPKRIYREDCLVENSDDPSDTVIFGEYPTYLNHTEYTNRHKDREGAVKSYEWAVLYEYYDLVSGKFYVFADHVERPLYEGPLPYSFLKNPFHLQTFNDNLMDVSGMSDAELIMRCIDNLNEMASMEMWHAKTTIPAVVIHDGLVDDDSDFAEAYESLDGPGQVLRLSARRNVRVDEVMGQTPTPNLPLEFGPAMGRLESVIQNVLGSPDYMRGATGGGELATELSLANAALKTRQGRRRGVIEATIAWAAHAGVELYREFMDPETEIPIRKDDEDQETLLTRAELGFDAEDSLFDFKYRAEPYDALAEDDVAALKMYQEMMPYVQAGIELGEFSPRGVYGKLAEILKCPEFMKSAEERAEEQAQQMSMMGMQPQLQGGQPGVPNVAGVGENAVGNEATGDPHNSTGGVHQGTGALEGNEMNPLAAGAVPAPKPPPL